MAGSEHSRVEKVNRLHDLLMDTKKPLTMSEICDELQCSCKTVERVLSDYRKQGAPVECFKEGGTHFYRLQSTEDSAYQLPGIWLHKDELVALFAIREMIQDLPDGVLSEKLQRLWSRIQSLCQSLHLDWDALKDKVKILPIAGRRVDDTHFRVVVEALMRKQRLALRYQALGRSEGVDRVVSPLRVLRYRDNWYLDAFCHEKFALRSFALSRILHATVVCEVVQEISLDEQMNFFSQSYGIFNGAADRVAVICFSGIAALEIAKETWHPRQEVNIDLTNGTLLLHVPYHNETELIMDVLRWGECAQVISPSELREAVAKKIAAMHSIYQLR